MKDTSEHEKIFGTVGQEQTFECCSQLNQEKAKKASTTVVKQYPCVEWTLLVGKREGEKAPFLVDNCEKDREFSSLMHFHKPFAAKHGSKGSLWQDVACLLYTSPSPRDLSTSRMPSSA